MGSAWAGFLQEEVGTGHSFHLSLGLDICLSAVVGSCSCFMLGVCLCHWGQCFPPARLLVCEGRSGQHFLVLTWSKQVHSGVLSVVLVVTAHQAAEG